MKKTLKQKTILKRAGSNQHTLYGQFKTEEKAGDFLPIEVTKESILKHEESNGDFAEHQPLKVTEGNWVQGKQVEYNPFLGTVGQIWD